MKQNNKRTSFFPKNIQRNINDLIKKAPKDGIPIDMI